MRYRVRHLNATPDHWPDEACAVCDVADPTDHPGLSIRMLAILRGEIERQDTIHPQGFPATRDGVRMALAALEDEIAEAKEAWREERQESGWAKTRTEVLQAAAVAIRTLRDAL